MARKRCPQTELVLQIHMRAPEFGEGLPQKGFEGAVGALKGPGYQIWAGER